MKRLTLCASAAFLLGVYFLLPATPAAGQNFALDFTNNRVNIPYLGTGVSFAEISLEAWAYWRGHAGSEGTSGIMEGRGSTLHWQLNANRNVRIRLEGVDQNANAGVQQNEWFHLAVAYNRATRELRCYKNGALYHTGSGDSGTNNFWTSGDAQFGTSYRAGDRRWNGMLDEIRIWNKARTEAQIQENMSQELQGTEAGLIAYWKLNEGQGTTAVDSSPNKHDGTIVGATWTTNAAPVTPVGFAYGPAPNQGATDVPRDTVLSWTRGTDTEKQDVYFGTDRAAVEAAKAANPQGVLVSQGQAGTTYVPAALLEYGRTYYWRVDGSTTGPNATVFTGRVWSFTVEPYGYPLTNVTATASSSQVDMGPEKTVDGSGLDAGGRHSTDSKAMWLSLGIPPNWIQYEFDKAYKLHEMRVWNSNQMIEPFVGFGAKTVKIEYSPDGNTWTERLATAEFAQAPGLATYEANTTVSLGGVLARYVRLTIVSSWGVAQQNGLSEVRFSSAPMQARGPEPAAQEIGVAPDVTLNWRPGREAVSHQVYFGTDPNAVANGTVGAQSVTEHRYSPAPLVYGTTYYWRVDEVNAATYPGAVWSFTTQAYGVVEDFESYSDKPDAEVFSTWIDGFTDGTNGSTVGHMTATNGTFGETTILHGGKQSMPFVYDNSKFSFSEATRTFDEPQDWTAHGLKSLSLYFQGAAGNGGQLYLKINNTKVAYNGKASDLARPAWLPWNIDLSTVGGNLGNVTKLTIGVEGAGAAGTLYFDDLRLYPKAPEYITPADPGRANLKALYAFEGNANDTSGNGLNGTLKQAQLVDSGRPGGGLAVRVQKVGSVDLGNPPALDFSTGGWTVTAWFKTAMTGTGDANQGTIYGKGGDNTGGHRYGLIMSQTTEGVVTLVCDDNVTRYDANSRTRTNDDQWHFVAAQREGTSLRIFIDGTLEGTTTIPATYDLAGTQQHNAYVGAMTDNRDGSLYKLFDGLIDDVRVYDKALSQGEILWLMGQAAPVAKPF